MLQKFSVPKILCCPILWTQFSVTFLLEGEASWLSALFISGGINKVVLPTLVSVPELCLPGKV